MFQNLNALLDQILPMQVPGFDCLVYKDGHEVFRRKDGFSDQELQIPIQGTERYNLYSCSKIITCTAALQLLEKKAYRLEDELCDYMPEFRHMSVRTPEGIVPAKKHISIWNLFTMTAGFSYDTQSPSLLQAIDETHGACPTRETMKYLSREPLLFEPGSHWAYSLCHDVLAAFVEVLSGLPFQDYLSQNIFGPLGMKQTTFLLPAVQRHTIAPQYAISAYSKQLVRISPTIQCSNFVNHSFRLGTDYASGGAGCVSTVEDFLLFLEAMRKGDVLSQDMLRKMTTNQLNPEQLKDYWKTDYGYGLGVRCPIDGQISTDYGWGGAAGAYLAIDPTYNYTVFYAQHVLNSPASSVRNSIASALQKDFQENP